MVTGASRTAAVASIALALTLLTASDAFSRRARHEPKSAEYLVAKDRWDRANFERTSTDELIALLQIREGMTILDIGTGAGHHAMKYASLLNGTGAVYATDTQPEFLDQLKRAVAVKGLSNLTPVLVQEEGFDPFYRRGGFDLVTIFHCSVTHRPDPDYFTSLREAMNPGARLVIMKKCEYPPFSPSSFKDLDGLIAVLSSRDQTDPLLDTLRRRIRLERRADRRELSKAQLARIIASELNQALPSADFANVFTDGERFLGNVTFSPDEESYAYTRLLFVNARKADKPLNRRVYSRLAALNRLLIVQSLREFLRDDLLACDPRTKRIADTIDRLRTAGFELQGIHDFVPFELLLDFRTDQASRPH